MTDIKHIIEPERMGLWVAVTFILTLLALVISLVCLQRITVTTVATQVEIKLLNNKIEDLTKTVAAQAAAAAEKKAESAPVPAPAPAVEPQAPQ